jgi:hypothetical protein
VGVGVGVGFDDGVGVGLGVDEGVEEGVGFGVGLELDVSLIELFFLVGFGFFEVIFLVDVGLTEYTSSTRSPRFSRA